MSGSTFGGSTFSGGGAGVGVGGGGAGRGSGSGSSAGGGGGAACCVVRSHTSASTAVGWVFCQLMPPHRNTNSSACVATASANARQPLSCRGTR